jgi:hypothetical protein
VCASCSKGIWRFGCNGTQHVCIHKECLQHCDMCGRIEGDTVEGGGLTRCKASRTKDNRSLVLFLEYLMNKRDRN